MRFADQAQFHPGAIAWRLRASSTQTGSRVFELMPAVDVEEGPLCVVKTDRHDVGPAFVVLATHLPFLDRGAFFARCHPEREYVLAVALEDPCRRGMYITA